jgi:hypothetical protein
MKNIHLNIINQLTLFDIGDMESLEKYYFLGALGFIYCTTMENVFGSLKNKWKFLKHFILRMDKTCCVPPKNCEMWNEPI